MVIYQTREGEICENVNHSSKHSTNESTQYEQKNSFDSMSKTSMYRANQLALTGLFVTQ